LCAAQFDALGLVQLINNMVPQCEEKRTVSLGQTVKAMVINGLGFANHTFRHLDSVISKKQPKPKITNKNSIL